MKAEKIIDSLYRFFIGFGIFVFIGTLVELIALNHTREELQYVPFVLVPLGIILAVLLLLKTGTGVQKLSAIGMWIVAGGGLVGMAVHVISNLESVFEGGATLSFGRILQQAIGGRNPLLAPGTLTIGAAMILAVYYAKKALKSS